MNIHVLSGDSLVEKFREINLDGEMIVCRECLIDGNVNAESLEEFWNVRAKYLAGEYPKPDGFYEDNVKDEFVKLWSLADGNTVNLWFEYELFCQVNLWFTIWLLRNTETNFNIVYPLLENEDEIWKGFGYLDVERLKESFSTRIKLSHDDVYLGVQLWVAFQNRDYEKLAALGKTEWKSFPSLKEVTEAAVEIDTRPKESLRNIIADGNVEFGQAFRVFNETEPVYGFGDLQVKKIYDKLAG